MEIKDYLKETVGMLEDIGLDVFLYSSTLLHLVRRGELTLKQPHDKELNIGCLAEDLTPEIIEKIRKRSKWMILKSTPIKRNHLIYFSTYPAERDIWSSCEMFTLLAPFYKYKNIRYEYMSDYRIKVWDKKYYKKSKWGTIEYDGYKYKALYKYKQWFADYFGDDWKREKRNWSWQLHAKNLLVFDDIQGYAKYFKLHDIRYD